jgi:cell division GTPase FtsZ
MIPCIVGIGGAGGNILMQFLQSQDARLPKYSFGEHLAFGDVKGIWLDSASQDAQEQTFYHDIVADSYPCYLICHDLIDKDSRVRDYVRNTYGYDLKAQGYDRRAEYLKGIMEIFEIDSKLKEMAIGEFDGEADPFLAYMWKNGIRPFTTISRNKLIENEKGARAVARQCDNILFIASLGGGTGTGFINPITSYIRSEEKSFLILALGILTQKGDEPRHAVEGQRDLGAIIAIYDMLTKCAGSGIDGLILMDNQILKKRNGANYKEMDRKIYSAIRPLLDHTNYPGDELQDDAQAMRRVIWEIGDKDNRSENSSSEKVSNGNNIMPPILVPCYYSQKGTNISEKSLVDNALDENGRLFSCDPVKAERAYVFTRGFVGLESIKEAIHERTSISLNDIKVYRKIGDGKTTDVLILLRNPYGSRGFYEKENSFEGRIHDLIIKSMNYLNENQVDIIESYQGYKENTKKALRNYFYGENGLEHELEASLERLKSGQKPFFVKPLKIFGECEAASEDRSGEQKTRSHIASQLEIGELVREELERILSSKEGREKINEILKG